MRMERINEHQVRCVVTNQDLLAHKITSKDLKYGSREMQDLFREMLKNASEKYHFNEDGLPVMIEAIPVNNDELLIIISAVEDADELDPHFANFRSSRQEKETGHVFLDEPKEIPDLKVAVIFMKGFNEAIRFAKQFTLVNATTELYDGPDPHTYYFVIHRPEDMEKMMFIQFINSLNEIAEVSMESKTLYALLKEHHSPIMQNPHLVLRSF